MSQVARTVPAEFDGVKLAVGTRLVNMLLVVMATLHVDTSGDNYWYLLSQV